jgi:hypothetical protein
MTALLRFANDELCRDVVHEAGWTGPWPPPDRLSLVVGVSTGRTVVAEDGSVQRLKNENEDWADHVIIQPFRRVRASTLTDEDMGAMAHVMRGAVYMPIFTGVDL